MPGDTPHDGPRAVPGDDVPPDVPFADYCIYLETVRRVWGRGLSLRPMGRPATGLG